PHSRRVAIATGVTLTRLLIPALSVGLILFAARNSGLLGDAGTELMRGLTSAAFLMIAAYALGGAFFSPKVPELRLSSLEDSEARHAHRWLIVLAGVAGLDAALVERGTHIGMAVEGLALLNAIMLVAGGFAVLRLLSTMSPIIPPVFPSEEDEDDPKPDEPDGFWGPNTVRVVRLALTVAALTAPVLALIGFFAASRYLFYPLMFSGGVIGFCILLFHVVRAVVEDAASPAQGDSRPRKGNLRLIPVAVGFILFCIAVPVLSLIWGADVVDLVTAWRRVEQGFTIGEIVLSPIDFLSFAVVFSLGYVITRIAQGALSRSVLPYTGIDAGGRAAIIAGVGYLGVPLAALIAISATGLDLSNIAIVAGALSVGIGFGLQNIVNNFVSGIILLIERPIKAGDWVQVPSGHGYVKEVNVRSTRIESFDKCDFFVPNSELISSTVVNWTHNDLMGRMIVQTRCAYGNDPRVVEKILLDIARSHPMVLRRPAPYVLFFDFGDHGLEFQIRAFLRDVNWILNVQSDIRYEIHRRFVEAGISIPVPQQDLRLRNPEELGDALAAAMTPSLPPPPSDDLATGGAEPVAFRRRAGAPPPVSLPGGEPDPDR
ncbi:MAG: mechanosensitive ion channel domain-containing protein, partial [Pseudomonadota bacterium]